jgi:hypothetical protein
MLTRRLSMPHSGRIPVAAALAALLILPASTEAQAASAIAAVDRAERIFSGTASPAEVQAGLQSLLAAISETAAGLDLPAEFVNQIAEARRIEGVDPKATRLLNDCYKLLNHGTSYRAPASVRDMPGAMEYLRSRIAAGRTLLVKGEASEAVRALLDAAVLIVTPFPSRQ